MAGTPSIAAQASTEHDDEKLMKLVAELCEAFDLEENTRSLVGQ